MKNSNILFYLLAIIISISSCSPMIYAPIDEVAPILDNKGDLEIGANLSIPADEFSLLTSGGNPAVQLSAAYSPIDHLGVFGKYGRELAWNNFVSNGLLGVGYYEYFESNFLFQAYLVGGLERRDLSGWSWFDGSYDIQMNKRSLGFQPSIVYVHDFFELGIGGTYKKVWNHDVTYVGNGGSNSYESLIPQSQKMLEPYVSASVKLGALKLGIKYGRSYQMDKSIELFNSNRFLSMGIGMSF